MVKAIIFDLNGVFIQGPKLSVEFERKFGVSIDDFLPALKDVMAKVRMPNANDAFDYWKPYLDRWNVKLSREEFFGFVFGLENEVLESIQLARALKSMGTQLYVLSNNYKERTDYYAKAFPFLKEIIDKVYYSWQTGFVKPDERAYKLVLSENNLRPEECVYLDDDHKNVDMAKSLGIDARLYEGPAQILELCHQK